jgi:hypothetical protein
MQQFDPNETVWFINKFKRRVTGQYLGVESVLTAKGPILAHIVLSDNAFGPNGPKAVQCIVSDGHLHREDV